MSPRRAAAPPIGRALLLLLLVVGCGKAPDPFAPQPDTSAGLTDVAADLGALLEHGALRGACDRYRAGDPTDRKALLLCGKSMFFYETFGTDGLPTALLNFFGANFPDELGIGFTKQGLIVDPASPDPLPIGLAPTTKPLGGKYPAHSFTCASCHFARLPDGRFAVGAPNHRYEYGKWIVTLILTPQVALLKNPAAHDPDAVRAVQPLLDRLGHDPALTKRLVEQLAVLNSAPPTFSVQSEHYYATWPSGTMDFLIEPIPLDDHVHTISKIPALWGIPDPAAAQASGMAHGLLAWSGNSRGVMDFLHAFVEFGLGPRDEWPDEKLRPLTEYIHSLRAVPNPTPPDAALVARGRALFTEKKCSTCHDAPRGGGKRVYTYDEIGTDRAMARWLDPDLTGKPCCNISLAVAGGALSHGIKSPRLAGLWAASRLLHNGSVATLEELFCSAGPRGRIVEPAYGDGGHDFTCQGLSADDKRALIALLRAI